ncbi:NAD(P)-dependent dehydrogenase, short-chain alcohol dehydrogenase family [Oscillospiraceae bacterium]|nr:NAD(P)-dependent dehydrogenase, short-chain alcohol dehydrogenase family [Oscillospiraceae bacterium]
MSKYLVLGASSGIGRAVCDQLALRGDSLVLAGRDINKLELLRSELSSSEDHISVLFDADEPESIVSVFERSTENGIKLDGMVYCIGRADVTPLRTLKISQARSMFSVNFFSFVTAVSLYAKPKYSNRGSIVGISSANSHYPQKCMSMYAASKGAMEAAVRTMAIELADKGISVNCVIPGAVNTDMFGKLSDDVKEMIAGKQLLGVSSPEDVASSIVFLLKEGARVMTGRSVYIDGGILGQ